MHYKYKAVRQRTTPHPTLLVWILAITQRAPRFCLVDTDTEDLSLGNHRLLIIRCRRMFNDVKQYPVYEVNFRNVLLKDETVNY